MADANVAKKEEVVICDPARVNLVEQVRQDWVVDVADGVSLAKCLMPEFWSHKSQYFKPFDHIELRADDGTWTADLVVLGCDRNWARVHLKHEYKLTTSDVSMTQAKKHEIKFKGSHLKFCVIRLSDQQIVREKCNTEDDARLWMTEHERTTQAVI